MPWVLNMMALLLSGFFLWSRQAGFLRAQE